jgi:hypothetical protein
MAKATNNNRALRMAFMAADIKDRFFAAVFTLGKSGGK